jgi:aldose 1-epimerase
MKRYFGELEDGTVIHSYTLANAALSAEILDYGGILRSLRYRGRDGVTECVIGLPTLAEYRRDPAYLGVIAGRFANRIAASRFTLDGVTHQLSANEGANHLHGGLLGFGRRVWTVLDDATDATVPRLRLGYRSPDGEEGYPGTLDVVAEFTLDADCLTLAFSAHTDRATPVNLTYHPYFNLGGSGSGVGGGAGIGIAAGQILDVPADRWLPVDAALLPTGEFAAVANTPFDFRTATAIGARADDAMLAASGGYDHCLVLAAQAPYAADLYSPRSGIGMRISSDKPAIQIYEGQGLDRQHPTLGRGVCLEPQDLPDAPNHAHFPSCIVRPGTPYTHTIRYAFRGPASDRA